MLNYSKKVEFLNIQNGINEINSITDVDIITGNGNLRLNAFYERWGRSLYLKVLYGQSNSAVKSPTLAVNEIINSTNAFNYKLKIKANFFNANASDYLTKYNTWLNGLSTTEKLINVDTVDLNIDIYVISIVLFVEKV